MKIFKSQLQPEIDRWLAEKIIDADQRNRILALYPDSTSVPSRLIAIFSTIGGLLLVAGIFLFISSNWQVIPDWGKIAGTILLLAGAHYTGYQLKFFPGSYPKTGEVCFMIGCILFLAGIALISQIFHLDARPASGVLVWWLGIFLIPWITQSRGAKFVSLVAFLVWLGMEFCTDGSWLALDLTPNHHYYDSDRLMLSMAALFFLLGSSLFLGGLALRSTSFNLFAGIHEKWGLLILNATLYILSFSRYLWNSTEVFDLNPLPILFVGGIFLTTLWAAKPQMPILKSIGPWLLFCLLPICGVLSGWDPLSLFEFQHQGGRLFGWFRSHGGEFWSILSWISLFCFDLALIRVGVASGQQSWINLGIGMIALNIITRYFDLFGTMMEGALLFMTTGVLILGGGIYLERKRRHLLAILKKESL